MNKFLLTLGVAAAATFGAYSANPSVSPPEGTLDMDIYAGGVGNVEVNVKATINRDCEGFATLMRNGEIVKSVPASNERYVYCLDGFSKVTTGKPNIGFYTGYPSPATRPGNYTVTIPSDFYRINGVGNDAFVLSYVIPGTDYDMVESPAFSSSVASLTEIKLTFVGCTNVKYNSGAKCYFETSGADVNFTPVINGNVVTIAVPESVNVPGNIAVNCAKGAFSFTNKDGESGTSNQIFGRYTIANTSQGSSVDGYVLTGKDGEAAVGVYDKIEAYEQIKTENTSYGQTYYTYSNRFFNLALPEGCLTSTVMMSRPQFYTEDKTTKAGSTFTLTPNADKTGFYLTTSGETANEMPLANGTYYLIVPAGAFYYTTSAGGRTACPKLEFGPFVIMDMATTGYYLNPDPEEPLTELQNIVITFDEGSTVEWSPSEWGQINYKTVEYDFRGVAKDNTLSINLPKAFTVPGEWTLSIPSQALTVNGKPFSIEATYTIYRSYITDVKVSCNGDPVTATLNTEDEEYGTPYWSVDLKTADNSKTADLVFELPYGYDSLYYQIQSVGGGPVLAGIPATDLVAAGYVLAENNTIPNLAVGATPLAFAYGQEGTVTEPTLMVVNVSGSVGVEAIDAEEGEVEYFNLQGVKVEKPENGVYIKVVNGKATKAVVK